MLILLVVQERKGDRITGGVDGGEGEEIGAAMGMGGRGDCGVSYSI